jgi:hypothetical protein
MGDVETKEAPARHRRPGRARTRGPAYLYPRHRNDDVSPRWEIDELEDDAAEGTP